MIDARAFGPRNAIQNLGTPGKVEHGNAITSPYLCKVIISHAWGKLFSNSIYVTVTRVYCIICNGDLLLCLSVVSYVESEGYGRRFRFRSHGSTSCHGQIAEAQQPKLLGVGMILYRRYLGITVETSSFRWLTPGPIGGPARMGASSPLPPSSVTISIYLLIKFIKAVTIYPRKYNQTMQRDVVVRRRRVSRNHRQPKSLPMTPSSADVNTGFTMPKLDTAFDLRWPLSKILCKWRLSKFTCTSKMDSPVWKIRLSSL